MASLEIMTLIALHFFLLLCELLAKGDDVGHVGYPCLMEGFGHVGAVLGHDLEPVGSEMVQYAFDGTIGIPKVLFIDLTKAKNGSIKLKRYK